MKFGTSISSLWPQQESSPTTWNLSIFWMQKDTNFGNAIIIHHLGPEKCQKSYPERHKFWEHHNSLLPWARELPKSNPKRHEFWETALIDPSKKCQQIRKVFVFPEFCTIIEMHSLTPSTLTNQSLLGTPISMFSLIADQLWYIQTVVP